MRKIFFLLVVFLISAGINAQSLNLASVFSDHMILQRNKIITFWGTTAAQSEVRVTFNQKQKSTLSNADGNWKVTFPAMREGGPLTLTVENNNKKIELTDILIGDVWLCSGQSNMEFILRESANAGMEIPKASYPQIRLYNMQQITRTNNVAWSPENLRLINENKWFTPTRWTACTPATAAVFSAAGYYFGKMIHTETNIPIGLICNAVGGSTTESWIDSTTLKKDPELKKLFQDWNENELVQAWCRERAAKNTEHAVDKKQKHPFHPSYLYTSGIAQLTKFPIKGAIWYQGESNAHNIALHEKLFPALIKSWRSAWNDQFPFYYVQLSSMAVGREGWEAFRNSQRKMMLNIPNTGMAVSSDVGDSTNVHPVFKKEVGERLARWALSNTYHRKITPGGPLFRKVQFRKNEAVISFSNGKQMKTSDGKAMRSFEIAGSDKVFYPVKAEISGEKMILTSDKVLQPRFVRYGWSPFSAGNLVNGDNLPASTFSSEP